MIPTFIILTAAEKVFRVNLNAIITYSAKTYENGSVVCFVGGENNCLRVDQTPEEIDAKFPHNLPLSPPKEPKP